MYNVEGKEKMNELLFWLQAENREHFDRVQVLMNLFIEAAEKQMAINQRFVDNDTYKGELADSAKEYVGEVENELLSQLSQASEQLIQEQEKILQEFKDEVDESDTAILYTSTLEKINQDYNDLKEEFTDIRDKTDSIVNELQAYSEYGSFTRLNPAKVLTDYKKMIGCEYYGSTMERGIVLLTLWKFRQFDELHRHDIENSDFTEQLDQENSRRRTLEQQMKSPCLSTREEYKELRFIPVNKKAGEKIKPLTEKNRRNWFY